MTGLVLATSQCYEKEELCDEAEDPSPNLALSSWLGDFGVPIYTVVVVSRVSAPQRCSHLSHQNV